MPAKRKQTPRTCKYGHRYFKSTDCPTCPECEKQRKPMDEFMDGLSAPARRALENAGIRKISDLSGFTEKQLLALHGFGPASLPQIKEVLKKNKLSLKK